MKFDIGDDIIKKLFFQILISKIIYSNYIAFLTNDFVMNKERLVFWIFLKRFHCQVDKGLHCRGYPFIAMMEDLAPKFFVAAFYIKNGKFFFGNAFLKNVVWQKTYAKSSLNKLH